MNVFLNDLPVILITHNEEHEAKEEQKEDKMEIYLKISNQFTHLNLMEIMEFEEKLKANNGVLTTHLGKFRFNR